MKTASANIALIALVTWGTSTTAFATDPFGFYIGAAAGESDVRLDRSLTSTLNDISEHHSG